MQNLGEILYKHMVTRLHFCTNDVNLGLFSIYVYTGAQLRKLSITWMTSLNPFPDLLRLVFRMVPSRGLLYGKGGFLK